MPLVVTVTLHSAVLPINVPLMVTLPSLCAVTLPFWSTEAILSSEDVHCTVSVGEYEYVTPIFFVSPSVTVMSVDENVM